MQESNRVLVCRRRHDSRESEIKNHGLTHHTALGRKELENRCELLAFRQDKIHEIATVSATDIWAAGEDGAGHPLVAHYGCR